MPDSAVETKFRPDCRSDKSVLAFTTDGEPARGGGPSTSTTTTRACRVRGMVCFQNCPDYRLSAYVGPDFDPRPADERLPA